MYDRRKKGKMEKNRNPFREYNCVFKFRWSTQFSFCFNIIYHATQFYLVIFLIFNVQCSKTTTHMCHLKYAYVIPWYGCRVAEMCCVRYNNIDERQTTKSIRKTFMAFQHYSVHSILLIPQQQQRQTVLVLSLIYLLSHLFHLFSSVFHIACSLTLGIPPNFFAVSHHRRTMHDYGIVFSTIL